jgi:hypothetical protein
VRRAREYSAVSTVVGGGHPVPDQHQTLRVLEGERPQEDGVGDAEDGDAAPDPERESDHDDGGERRTMGERADRIADIPQEHATSYCVTDGRGRRIAPEFGTSSLFAMAVAEHP